VAQSDQAAQAAIRLDQVVAKSVKTISKDFIKINKKNIRSAKHKEHYWIYIYKVFRQVHPESQ